MVHVFGTICLDRIQRIPYFPKSGGYVEIESEETLLGGEASNTANALRAWGTPFCLYGNGLGDSPDAQVLRELLMMKGLDDGALPAGQGRTPVCDILITPDGDRTMLGRGFASMPAPVPAEDLPLEPGAWFTADPNMGAYARAAVRHAQDGGMRTYLLDFFRPDDPVAEGSWWQSSTDWVGERENKPGNLAWAQAWTERHGCTTILTDGPNGFALARPGHSARWMPPFTAPKMVDTTGAGDVFRAGMLSGLHDGIPLGDALAFAAAAGSLKCGYRGATRRVPTREEIAALLSDNPSAFAAYRSVVP